jgi:hypothetical protein
MMKLQPTSQSQTDPVRYSIFKRIVVDGCTKISTDVKNKVLGFDLDVDILFNAHTETNFGTHIRKNDNFGFKKIYADSGGLQIVTLGKQIDDSIKASIYETQKVSDYAMCFDEIPTVSLESGTAGRASVSDKLYQPERATECAIKTALNIKDQCQQLKSSDTSVFYIIQGNTSDDMVQWFDDGATVMDDYSKIGGLALADTCMGNGTLETIEMIAAYNSIYTKYGADIVKNHIHLLGVGSVSRLLPVIYSKEALLPKDITISFDSTSFSMTYMMGKFKNRDNSNVTTIQYKSYFNEILDIIYDTVILEHPDFDRDVFIQHVIDKIRSTSETINDCRWPEVAQAFITVTLLYQLYSFISSLNQSIKKMSNDNGPLGQFRKCKTYADFQQWHINYSRFVDSKRISRSGGPDLTEFFA